MVGAVSAESVSPDEEGCFADFLPVKACQMDIARREGFADIFVERNPAGQRMKRR